MLQQMDIVKYLVKRDADISKYNEELIKAAKKENLNL